MGLKAAVQALKKAEELKARVSRHDDLLNNSEVWSDQQQLQTVYHQVLVLDLEYALDKKVEQELWTLGFKNHIAALQHLSRDKKNPKRSEYQALLSWCLEAASGFYLTLLQELCSAFELDLPFRRRGAVYGQSKSLSLPSATSTNASNSTGTEQFTQPHKSSCLYICQYCLVHLGDIARYRLQRKQAESFYRHAILLSPSSGQPYNQLALLEASRGDKLATVFHYVRSISVKHPFPAAATNLSNTLSAVIDQGEPLTEMHSKLSLMEFLNLFLRVHGLLHLAADLDQAELCVKSLNATFTALVATNAFSSMKLIQMTAINLYTLRHTLDSFSTENLSPSEIRVKNLTLDLLAGAFSAYLLPIYTMPNDGTLLDYYALPAIKLTLDWLKTAPNILKETVFTRRLQIWPSLCKLLNVLQTISGENDVKNSEKIPLPEDRDLQCFLPLVNAYKDYDFTISMNLNYDLKYFNKLRVTRLVNLSVWLSTQSVDNNILITAKKVKNPTKMIFEPCIKQPDPTTELLEELKHFNIKENTNITKEVQKSPVKCLTEKRNGILKPQGSLEKAREEREQHVLSLIESSETCSSNSNSSTASNVNAPPINILTMGPSHGCNITGNVVTVDSTSKLKRNRQNVAMQVLAKKNVEDNNSKQVTFVTEPIVKNKEVKQQQPPLSSLLINNTTNNKIHSYNESSAMIYPGKVNINKNNLIDNNMYIQMPGGVSDIQQKQQHHQQQKQLLQNSGNSYQMPYSQFQTNPSLPTAAPPLYPMQSTFSQSTTAAAANSFPHLPLQQQASSAVSYHPRQYTNSAFDINNVPLQRQQQQQQQQQSYHSLPPQQQSEQLFHAPSWLHDDTKLPMPPSTWTSWTHNQKSIPHNLPPPQQQQQQRQFPTAAPAIPQSSIADLFHHSNHQNYSIHLPTNNTSNTLNNFMQENNLSSTLANHNMNQYNNNNSNSVAANSLNNTMSLWNSGPNFQPNLQMIFNHQPSSTTSIKQNTSSQPSFHDPTMSSSSEMQKQTNSPVAPSGGYSLFNSNWAPNLTTLKSNSHSPPDRATPLLRQQSLFSGPGPSPLERLLQQQKQQRGGASTAPLKEDT